MKINKKYITPLLIAGTILTLTVVGEKADAAVLMGNVDTSGAITGTAGATYYSTNSWKDMLDTYQSVTPTSASNNTVFFNIVGDVQGESSIGGYGYSNTGNTNNGVSIVNGKSLSINGNGHTLYLDSDTNYTTPGSGSGAGAGYIRGSFRVPNAGVSEATVLQIKNASITNNITGGIFQSIGTGGSAPTFIYEDVKVSNGTARYAAQPIRNDNGRILFYGTNEFNIQQDHNMNSVGLLGADNQGEWIQGGKWVEVVTGTTTLNQTWGYDQPFYTYNNNSHTMKVADGAHMVWNLNDTYTMYYDDGNSGPMVWDIGNNASFDIRGTAATASRYSGGWFMWIANNSWTVNVGNNARLAVSTGGGSINLNEFQGTKVIRWNIGQDATVLLNNLRTSGSLVTGEPGAGSAITLNDPKAFVLNTQGGVVFDSTVNRNNNFPLTIAGNGLRTHASTVTAPLDPNQLDLITPNQNNLASNDIWYRQNTGTITGLGATASSALTPNNYTAADLNALKNAKYISWYQPTGYWMRADKSSMVKTFNISLNPNDSNGTPADSSWSNLINGNETQTLVVGDDRGQAPNFNLSVTMMQNNFADNIDYYWSNPANPADSKTLGTGLAVSIASVTSDTSLPSFISMANAGQNYTLTAPKTAGIKIKAKNTLLTQTGTPSGIFKYTIADGPA
ncbi:hypothetical protein [Lactococcus formosensis]|uniref:hypothetical protein n=1 Tax=Lactococcus formosensis TaxID=1281486 RepID=UPI0002E246DD|nr:hypothetical protein [Lactococcus formosensis]MCH1722245.1 RTX toxin [Lactococcus formosensis]MDG6113970.1 RTX toxin [Lactococcus formosensis]MDG6115951.1 RTX toxin [Lactococcus formosensis]MDG6122039.1 RTX toxin [Lactococcus formosensis]MDG6123562.1 RTX toxin [Lactococcus formosensis]